MTTARVPAPPHRKRTKRMSPIVRHTKPTRSSLASRPRVCAPARALVFAVVLSVVPAMPAFAARLGGAYYVDDAEIGKAGSCEIESWSSFAANGDRIAVFSPACVVNPDRPVELGTNLVDLRSEGQEDVLATLTAKTVPIPIGRTGFGLAIAGAIVLTPSTRRAAASSLTSR